MSAIDSAGGPAFPVSIPGCGDNGWEGMSLRDFFAAQYMPTAIDRAGACKEYELKAMFGDRCGLHREEIAAALAYKYADAMLHARAHR